MTYDPQVAAADPGASAFVTANAGSGKTKTLVDRVARLLLHGAEPAAILCVTYTKAAAAEMQQRLFKRLGEWAVMPDEVLISDIRDIGEDTPDPARARRLFARALETPGGLKIQTIHAFCEKLLRRFPLEAGLSPGFEVLEDAAAAEVSARARDDVAGFALADGDGPLGAAYAHFSVELDYRSFGDMFALFEAKRRAIAAYSAACDEQDGVAADVRRRFDLAEGADADMIEAQALARLDWAGWCQAADALLQGPGKTDHALGAAMKAASSGAAFADLWALFCTQTGKPLTRLGSKGVDPAACQWLAAEQERLGCAAAEARAARIADATIKALTLARAYGALYEAAKALRRGLDFGDLIERTHILLTQQADAAWILYKLDGGIDHMLIDEAQDTAPDQWDILRALNAEFFAGAGARPAAALGRTVFAVGDEKQSIYSFQGAEPARFALEAESHRALVEGAGQAFARPLLEDSWRSAPAILSFVDAVFANPDTRPGVPPPPGRDLIAHRPRLRHGGCVDLWPLDKEEKREPPDAWDAPQDAEPEESARKRLARRIADEIAALIARGDQVYNKASAPPRLRSARPGDVLILVRRRDALFEEIIRALKRRGLPVAGADRLKLSEHIVFKDLLGLGQLLQFPHDDLTLAAVLRSPLCDLDEDDLFDLAHPRAPGQSLWQALEARGDERPAWRDARDLLAWGREEARVRAPFDLYARLLARLDGQGRTLRQRILTRLGREAEDAVDAFMGEVRAAETRGVGDLERLVDALAKAEVEVKRELESGHDEVRVMTVHGAKGMEAPIVFLPDTTANPLARTGCLMDAEGGGFLWAPRKAEDCPQTAKAREAIAERVRQESQRLLYVALTRARDRLVICGRLRADRKASEEGCWYELVQNAFDDSAVAAVTRDAGDGDFAFRRYGPDPEAGRQSAQAADLAEVLPPWASRTASAEPPADRWASPSAIGDVEAGPAPSPLASIGGLGRYRRGEIIHRLLQLLPDIAPPQRAAAAARLLHGERDLTAAQGAEMAQAALAVLEDARFAPVFGPGSRAEAALAGGAEDLPRGLAVSGRVDRLLVEPDRVLVIDFKTNRPSPARIEDTDRAYLAQMAVYVAVLRAIFPDRKVEAALVWTDGPKLMPVPENIVTAQLARLARGG